MMHSEEIADDPLDKADKPLDDEVAESVERDDHHDHEVKVHVVHVNEVEKTSFKEPETASLQAVWDDAYDKLEIPKKPKDVFQTGGEHPKSLMSHLGLSLKKAKHDGVITNFHFGIVSETGGA